ncbi:C40 family peptidase [Marinobacter sp.]|jgi:proteasome lid subunit RPN8/RPN11|uniref:C40 family peptidase n=1 Tax=Marinobacter sp. TaxID=50741 RepID=UPI002356D12C|nr:C40 family peptidase [Marinobacter sp.]|tara:strand:- start:523 stop:1230 length:708 start_codon:yes stop_codon:yes gene_type:complete
MSWKYQALEHAKKDAPHEACGLVAVYEGKEQYFPCNNIAQDKGDQFIIDPDDWIVIEDKAEIIAVVHSHPNHSSTASDADLASCEYLDLPFYIVTPETENWSYYEPSGYKKGLIGREWVWGIQDCWTLINDWYKEKKGINLRHWDRPKSPKDFSKKPLFEHGLPLTGFVQLETTVNLEEGDVLLMDTTNTGILNHVALYIGQQTILQHCIKKLSCRETYDQKYIQWTKKAYRYAK